jgi:hypothetical protein
MKLRFQANSLRLRLSQSEVARLAEHGRVEETVTFAPGQTLSYAVESGAGSAIVATFAANRIRVALPLSVARNWIDSDETGVEGSGDGLKVLVEKDFQCLHRPGEEDPDAYPNPMAGRTS